MSPGVVNLILRPIRFAFLIDPSVEDNLLQAIQLSTLMWGGAYNPIIPILRRAPRSWQGRHKNPSARQVAEGLLQAFDPDYVVRIGDISSNKLDIGHRAELQPSDVTEGLEKYHTLKYGISLFELLSHFASKELTFIRKQPLSVYFPCYNKTHQAFLASIFGSLSQNAKAILESTYSSAVDSYNKVCNLDNYQELFNQNIMFPRRLTSLHLGSLTQYPAYRRNCVMLIDARKILDIIDFWNLRAAGWNINPIPVQRMNDSPIVDDAIQFIEETYAAFNEEEHSHNTTVILKGRSVAEEKFRAFGSRLKVEPAKSPQCPKFGYQTYYPRIWNEWARSKDDADPLRVEAERRSIDFRDGNRITFRTLDPSFIERVSINSVARFANEIEVRTFGGGDATSEVIPEGGSDLIRGMGAFGHKEWRFSKSGPVYLSAFCDSSIMMTVPNAEKIFSGWLASYGLQTKLSSAGKIGRQILKQVDGIWGTTFLANENMLNLLQDLSKERSVKYDEILGKLSVIAQEQGGRVEGLDILRQLLKMQVIRLGAEIQCAVCDRRSWYSVTDLDYELLCRSCNERFRMPAESPRDIRWSYRAVGPFSLRGRANGSFAVLLTYRLFSVLLRRASTAFLSFEIMGDEGDREVDLGLFIKEVKLSQSVVETIFAECKSYEKFTRKDVERMRMLADQVPGCVLVFSTLRRGLSESETKLLRPLANYGRKCWRAGKAYSPVMIVTGTELLSRQEPLGTWRNCGGVHIKWASGFRGTTSTVVELCDATQQIYLGMRPWHEWARERRIVN